MSIPHTNFQISGADKPLIIFLHYFGGCGNTWGRVVDLLPDYNCITPDLRGFGRSKDCDPDAGVDDYADDVARLIDTLSPQQYVLAGHSMGGKIAMAVAARGPAGLKSLVLIAPSPPVPEPMSNHDREAMRQMFGDNEEIRSHLRSICADGMQADRLDDEVSNNVRVTHTAWNAWLDTGSRQDISNRMDKINMPVLVVGGDQDHIISGQLLREKVVRGLPGATLKMIPHSGHLLPVEQPAAVVAAFRSWL